MFDDAHADSIAVHRAGSSPVVEGALTGAVVCLILPFFVFLAGVVMIGEGNPTAAVATMSSPVLGALGGAIGGALLGLIDAPGRLATALARRQSPIALLLMAQLAGIIVAAPIFATVAATAGALIGLAAAVKEPGPGGFILIMTLTAWFYGLLLGAPGAVFYGTSRALAVRAQSPRYLPVIAAGATTAGVIVWLIWMFIMLGAVSTLMNQLL